LPEAGRKESFRNRNSFDRSAEWLRGFVVSKARVRRHRENGFSRRHCPQKARSAVLTSNDAAIHAEVQHD
jgi:hypothetical protein